MIVRSRAAGFLLFVAMSFAAMSFAAIVQAHDSRPVFIRIDATSPGEVLLAWKVPDSVQLHDAPFITLSANCAPVQSTAGVDERGQQPLPENTLQGLRWYRCSEPAQPTALELRWPGLIPSLSTLVRIEVPEERSPRTLHAGPGERVIALPVDEGTGAVFLQYLKLGVEHILMGYDHLLFVACLVLLAASARRILIAITGFTLAHSVTLVGAALDVISLPIPPVETVIALSIVFLAAELARNRRDTLTWRQPLVVASIFGLLHGFGFAAVLGEIGLPDGESLAALFAFNLGVETGQVLFVAVLLPLLAGIRRLLPADSHPDVLIRYASYPIGVLAMFWTFDRLSGFV